MRERFLELAAGQTKFKVVLLMDLAQGKEFGKVIEVTTPRASSVPSPAPSFQRSLGWILAADTFSGNPDRATAKAIEGERPEESVGWYNEGNFFIGGSGYKKLRRRHRQSVLTLAKARAPAPRPAV